MNADLSINTIVSATPMFSIDLDQCMVITTIGSGTNFINDYHHLTQTEFNAIAPILKAIAQQVPGVTNVSDPVYVPETTMPAPTPPLAG